MGRFARFVPAGKIRVEAAYAVPVERFADRLLSLSTSSPERLGDKVPAMRSAMHEALAPFAAGGAIEDIVEAQAEVFNSASVSEGLTSATPFSTPAPSSRAY